jgi:hypothetical protein
LGFFPNALQKKGDVRSDAKLEAVKNQEIAGNYFCEEARRDTAALK